MSYATDDLARAVSTLVTELASGRKSVAIRTGVAGGKMLTIVDSPKS